MEPLTDIDVKILKYIEQHGSADIDTIKKKFSDVSALEYRLKKLSTPEYRHIPNTHISYPKENTSYLKERIIRAADKAGNAHAKTPCIYELSEYGKRELQDYLLERRSEQKELWLKNAWIPIIVSLATTVIVNYILPKLPQILQWLSNTLSRISS